MTLFRYSVLALATAAVAAAAPTPEQPVPDRLDLPNAIRFALENNFAIRQARERVNQAEGGLVTATAGRLPKLSADASYSRSSDRITYGQPTQNWSAGLGINQTLFAGGAVQAGVVSARAQRESASAQLQAVTNNVLSAVRAAYFNVLRAQRTIKVREESIALLEEELKNARNRYEAGAGAQFDVLRAEVALANGRPPLITARNDFRIAVEELRQLLGFTNAKGENLGKVPEFLGELEFHEEKFTLEAALASARQHRPEFVVLENALKAAEQGIVIARAGALPTVGVGAGWDVMRDRSRPSVSDRLDGWSIGAQSSWAIWDGRATAGKVRSAKSLAEQARLSLESEQLAIDVEVRRAFASWQQANELVAASTKVVEQAKEALRLSRARFEVGAATQLDVLQAQVALTEAGNNQVQALFAHNVAVASLRTAMGLADPDAK